ADPAERALWLDDADAAARRVRVDEATPGHRLVWTWWHPGDEDGASTVSVVLAPTGDGGTRVVVTETAPPALRGTAGATASASAGAAPSLRATARRRVPAWQRCAADRWDGRLLGLELRFVAARALVA
ncbi:MAG TPA: SRPBCC domain-containing protein, partial [Acidimicrobiales bacterium]